jgi:hypothetical protein
MRRALEEAVSISEIVSLKNYSCGDILVYRITSTGDLSYCYDYIAYYSYLYDEWRSMDHLANRCSGAYLNLDDILPFDVRKEGFDWRAWSKEDNCGYPMGINKGK